MAETANIAEIAAKVADELFNVFLWKARGPRDENWPCEDPATHGKKRKSKKAEHDVADASVSSDAVAEDSAKHPVVTHPLQTSPSTMTNPTRTTVPI